MCIDLKKRRNKFLLTIVMFKPRQVVSRHNDRKKTLLLGDSSHLWLILASAVMFGRNSKPVDASLASCLSQAGNNLASKLQAIVSGNPNEHTINYGPTDYLSQIR